MKLTKTGDGYTQVYQLRFTDGGHEILASRYLLDERPYSQQPSSRWEISYDGTLEYTGSEFIETVKDLRFRAYTNPL